jgi:hypothetical protein
MRRSTRIVTGAVGVALLASAVAVPAEAATKPGAKCSRAGITVHVGNADLRCMKKAGKLVWVKLASPAGSGGGSGGSAGPSGANTGIASSASIPKVMQNWGLALAPYDAATGRAGVMQIAGVTPPTFGNASDDALYRHIVGLYGEEVRGSREAQTVFIAPLGTAVISMVDGTVCDLPTLYSNDYSVRVAPTGTACSGTAAPILFEHEHLISPTVKVGDKVRAGQQLGVVSDYNPHWKAKGMGVLDVGVFYSKNDNSGRPWHACPSNFLDPSKKDALLSTLASIQNAWIAQRGDASLYNLSAQNPVGCVTSDDITDSNKGTQ